jgi:malate dehydrogenase (oxaloacetate-decarboxylating)
VEVPPERGPTVSTSITPTAGAPATDLEARLRAAEEPSRRALELHPYYRGKIQVLPKCPVSEPADLALWYTPGVAGPCRAIAADPELVWEHTNRANSVAIVSDGSRVLGLGDLGPEAGLPVMEGKALLFKHLGGVDAVPLCIDVQDPAAIVDLLAGIEPSFGGINLEDIAQPRCFTVLDQARARLRIPVWHDDQQGTATVTLAALDNALRVVGKDWCDIRIVLVGAGAANVANYRLLKAVGVDPGRIVVVDSSGTLHPGRQDLTAQRDRYVDKWRICRETNRDRIVGGLAEALVGADVCIAYSRPVAGTIEPAMIERMAQDAIVFACANPIPEIWPWDATAAGALVVATGRCDLPNQVNNSLGFPAIFRGTLDVRATTITDAMAIAAARQLASSARARGIDAGSLLPTMQEWEVAPCVAAATGVQAQHDGVARRVVSYADLRAQARDTIAAARDSSAALEAAGCVTRHPG